MTRTQEVAMIEAAVKAGQVKKLPYVGEDWHASQINTFKACPKSFTWPIRSAK